MSSRGKAKRGNTMALTKKERRQYKKLAKHLASSPTAHPYIRDAFAAIDHAPTSEADYIAMARRNQNAEHRELLKQIFADPVLLKQTLDGDFLPQAYKDCCAKNGTSIHDVEHGMEWAIKRLLGTI